MKKIVLLVLAVLSITTNAAELDCRILVNLEEVSSEKVSTSEGLKVNIDSPEEIKAYVTEKADNHFVLEAYLVNYELRIYSEGILRENNDKIIVSTWGRETMADIECQLSKH